MTDPLSDLKVRREMYALLGRIGVFDPPEMCTCGHTALEHNIDVKRADGVWRALCNQCLCGEFRVVED
jgi:hypothetical protein